MDGEEGRGKIDGRGDLGEVYWAGERADVPSALEGRGE